MSVQKRSAGRRATPERIERILDCATALAASDGLGAVTMQSVATATGYIRPVVYDCFADRDELLSAVVSDAASSVRRRLAAAEQSLAGAGLVEGLMTFVDILLADPRCWRLFLQSTTGASDHTATTFAQVRAELRGGLDRWVRTAWPHDIDTAAVSVSLLGAIDVLGLSVVDQPQSFSRTRVQAMLTTIASNSIVS